MYYYGRIRVIGLTVCHIWKNILFYRGVFARVNWSTHCVFEVFGSPTDTLAFQAGSSHAFHIHMMGARLFFSVKPSTHSYDGMLLVVDWECNLAYVDLMLCRIEHIGQERVVSSFE